MVKIAEKLSQKCLEQLPAKKAIFLDKTKSMIQFFREEHKVQNVHL